MWPEPRPDRLSRVRSRKAHCRRKRVDTKPCRSGLRLGLHGEGEGISYAARYEACMDQRLEREHREFLLALTIDDRGTPIYQGVPAGIDLVIELTPT